nr:uncharacterized protein LOC112794957 [Arachis hypogaea]
MTWEAKQERYNEMVCDSIDERKLEEPEEETNPEAKRFYHLLEAIAKPLYDGSVHSELSTCVRMMSIKSESNHTQKSFDKWATLYNEQIDNPTPSKMVLDTGGPVSLRSADMNDDIIDLGLDADALLPENDDLQEEDRVDDDKEEEDEFDDNQETTSEEEDSEPEEEDDESEC